MPTAQRKPATGRSKDSTRPVMMRQEDAVILALASASKTEPRASEWELISAVQAGVSARLVREVADVLALPPGVMHTIISKRTLERREKDGHPLTPEQSDRLVRTVRIVSRAVETFGDRGAAIEWMTTPNPAMEGRTPISLIDTDPGVKLIEKILTRIDHGVFS